MKTQTFSGYDGRRDFTVDMCKHFIRDDSRITYTFIVKRSHSCWVRGYLGDCQRQKMIIIDKAIVSAYIHRNL